MGLSYYHVEFSSPQYYGRLKPSHFMLLGCAQLV